MIFMKNREIEANEVPEALAQRAQSLLDMTRRAYNSEIISYRVIRDRRRASWHPRRKMTNV